MLIHTGWGRLYGKDNPRYVKSCPGIGIAAAEWLAKQDPMLIGADNWPVEVAPNPDAKLSLPVHQVALVVHGIHLLENLKLDELAAKRVNEFAFVMQPLKAAGFSGLTVAPVAIRSSVGAGPPKPTDPTWRTRAHRARGSSRVAQPQHVLDHRGELEARAPAPVGARRASSIT